MMEAICGKKNVFSPLEFFFLFSYLIRSKWFEYENQNRLDSKASLMK